MSQDQLESQHHHLSQQIDRYHCNLIHSWYPPGIQNNRFSAIQKRKNKIPYSITPKLQKTTRNRVIVINEFGEKTIPLYSIDFKEHDHNEIITISPCVEYQSYLLHNEHELGDIVHVEIGPSSPVGGVDPVRTYDT